MATELPEGRYLSCAFALPPHAGGQTRALLMRNRILAREGGVRPELLTLGATPDHPERCERLREQGLVFDETPVRNIYEHYRDRGWGDQEPIGELQDLGRHRIGLETTHDGAAWRAVYQPPGRKRPIFEYLREDGSPYLRISRFSKAHSSTWPDLIQQIGADGAIVGEYQALGQWFRRWIRDLLAEGERAFVFIDSRFVVPHLVPTRGSRIHIVYQMHNIHVGPPRRWDSEMNLVYRRVLRRIGGMDAMVTLTERQREDIAARRGLTSNMFVVPNTVVLPEAPAQPPVRDPNLVTVVARLEPQKRLTDAIAAFQLVLEKVPAARLDIYGDGGQRERLQAEIDSRGLAGSVVLRGFDPRASETLWTSSAFLLTSSFEGYPLSTLESMSRGCPVVGYDIKYGPREQITDGTDGFLVPAGDKALLAQRVVELLQSPALVQRMSAAARARAARYGPAEFLASWSSVLHAAVEQKPLRTEIDDARLELSRLRQVGGERHRRSLRRGHDFALGPVASAGALELAGVLKIDGRSPKTGLGAVELGLAWVDKATGEVTDLQLAVRRIGSKFRLRARVPLPRADGRMRLRVTWRNSAWETEVLRLKGGVLKRTARE